MKKGSLAARRRFFVLVLVTYFLGGTASQKLVPGVDEIFPFFGWSLFSRVPAESEAYSILILRHRREDLNPPVPFLTAGEELTKGNRYLARKLIQSLGEAWDRGDEAEVRELRATLEQRHLRGRIEYELVYERFDPWEMWRSGEPLERESRASFVSGRGL